MLVWPRPSPAVLPPAHRAAACTLHTTCAGADTAVGSGAVVVDKRQPAHSGDVDSTFAYDRPLYWYPGHMAKALRLLRERVLPNADIVVEVRDARVPLSSANSKLDALLADRRRRKFIVYNKADLAFSSPRSITAQRIRALHPPETPIFFTNARDNSHVSKIIHCAAEYARKEAIRRGIGVQDDDHALSSASSQAHSKSSIDFTSSNRRQLQNQKCKQQSMPFVRMVVVGMPNVGKSSLINALRNVGTNKRKCVATAPRPGHTRAFGTPVIIYEDPKIYLSDSPGIMDAEIRDPIQGLKIALTGGTNETLVEMEHVASYLLHRLNSVPHLQTTYLSLLNLEEPARSVEHILPRIAAKYGLLRKGGVYDTDAAIEYFVKLYRRGALGRFVLDNLDSV